MAGPSPAPQTSTPAPDAHQRFRVAVEFTVAGDLRFLSHHDELRMLVRALVRAGWPLACSRGFNPLPRVMVVLPRNVGIASDCQLALVELKEPRTAAELFESLSAALPTGCRLERVRAPAPRGTPHALRVTYELRLSPGSAASIGPRVSRLTALTTLVVQRDNGPHKPARAIDIRPYIQDIELDGSVLRLFLRIADQRSARPAEVLTALGLDAEVYHHQLRRAEVQWDMPFAGSLIGPADHERKRFDKQESQQEKAERHK